MHTKLSQTILPLCAGRCDPGSLSRPLLPRSLWIKVLRWKFASLRLECLSTLRVVAWSRSPDEFLGTSDSRQSRNPHLRADRQYCRCRVVWSPNSRVTLKAEGWYLGSSCWIFVWGILRKTWRWQWIPSESQLARKVELRQA